MMTEKTKSHITLHMNHILLVIEEDMAEEDLMNLPVMDVTTLSYETQKWIKRLILSK